MMGARASGLAADLLCGLTKLAGSGRPEPSACCRSIANLTFRGPVSVRCRTGLRHLKTEIGKSRAETGVTNVRFRTRNPENSPPRHGRPRPNPRKYRGFSHSAGARKKTARKRSADHAED